MKAHTCPYLATCIHRDRLGPCDGAACRIWATWALVDSASKIIAISKSKLALEAYPSWWLHQIIQLKGAHVTGDIISHAAGVEL
jgi:hypothetical protein